MDEDKLLDRFEVAPGKRLHLKDHDPGWMGTPDLRRLGRDEVKARAHRYLEANLEQLAQAQELLWASDTHSVLVVLQAMDAAGKDGTIKHVMTGVNPQGCRVVSFKKPSTHELDHNFLWRYWQVVPERGQICIFNRSHYEDVLVVRVHPELLEASGLPPGKRGKSFWKGRYEDINAFERHLARSGTLILKFFLNVSRAEQKRRFLARLDDPDKHWKFSTADLHERGYWDQYQKAFEEAISATSTKWAPWFVIPADHKFVMRTLVAAILTRGIRRLDLRYPTVSAEGLAALKQARHQLESEK
ncbi:MAG: polyphosphate kinase 2 family protein [Phycisphaerales bacterium]|nr:polyphosphate kinase 2 family protein [Phycisphaerales bacterium]